MYIERLTFTNFRCFADPESIDLVEGLTGLVGANGSGKTSVLVGLTRMFGVSQHDRTVVRSDFHTPKPVSEQRAAMSIDAVLGFPELPGSDSDAVPEAWNQMTVTDSGTVKCRVRLEAEWTDDGTLDGNVEQKIYFVRTLGEIQQEHKHVMTPIVRSKIQMIYVQAARSGSERFVQFLRSRTWKAAQWSEGLKTELSDSSVRVSDKFGSEEPVKLVEEKFAERWTSLHRGGVNATAKFQPFSGELDRLVSTTDLVFSPSEDGRDKSVADLSPDYSWRHLR